MWTTNTIKDAVKASGSHWFSPSNMLAFGTRVRPHVWQGPGGIYFITEDDQYDRELPKRFTVRKFDGLDTITTHSKLCGFADCLEAMAFAEEQAQSDRGTLEEFQPITALEQFMTDLDDHSADPSKVTERDAKSLITHAQRHHHYMEQLCSNEDFCRGLEADGSHLSITSCRARIEQTAKRLGAKRVIFSGDPRGCTVKLVFKDGHTNDMGREGYCVPISLEEEEHG